jgi:HSP20 family molecular chaperone IbpA
VLPRTCGRPKNKRSAGRAGARYAPAGREGYYRTERAYGAFCRFVPIPEGADIEKLSACFKDGMLEIVMPVPKPPKPPKPIARAVDIK